MKDKSTRSKGTAGAEAKSAPQSLVAIVDDDESVRDAISSLFRSMGFRTELFAGGVEFLASPNLREFSCVILDVHMPGMDGLELQRRLAAVSHPIPIIFVTAFGDEHTRDRALRGGAMCFLSKPFSEDAWTLLNRRSPSAERTAASKPSWSRIRNASDTSRSAIASGLRVLRRLPSRSKKRADNEVPRTQ
jgi:FixJ family two-component response regulator